ncbi:colicin V synthesis protein [[Pantoea] beijingensis]|uniref:ABC-type xenobiotic transporter n=1 Tax=[Pantoea] beijingensis TaxID=1324864 RepID=A0A443IA83_9GAMM|nr:peptidase domain-containing ABC transporter [[Pantoea] beijingensis]RWR00826.1 colicin V synthesis protein [[Pantoea] beijingensis]
MNKSDFIRILSKLELNMRRTVPMVHQTESSECGLACLAMISSHYGRNIDLITLRQRFNLNARGATLGGLKNIATDLGMMTRGLSLELNQLVDLRLPCILHWGFNHFVVLTRVKRNRFILHDPAHGRRTVGLAEMSRHFTGVAMEVWPDAEFTQETVKNRIRFVTLVRGIQGLKGALIKIFCLSLVIETINLVMPVGTQLVMDHAIPATDRGLLTLLCCGLLLFILLRAAVSMVRALSSLVLETLISIQWQAGLLSHLLQLPLNWFERRKMGDIQSRFGSLELLQSLFTTSLIGSMMDIIMVSGVLVMMVLYGGYLTWIVLGFTALYIAIRLLTYGYYRQMSEESLVRSARTHSYFMETLYGIATVKMQGLSERRSEHWLNLEAETINTGIRVTRMDLLFGGLNTLIATCEQTLILWLGASMVMDNLMTIGMFIAFSSFREQFSDRMASLVNFLLQLRMMSLHNERIADIALNRRENRKPDIYYESGVKPVSLEIKNLSYRYDKQSAPVFSPLNIHISPGESVAITGPSGAGKTTLMKVLCGLLEPDAGQVIVEGIDIQQLGMNNYRRMTGCVMQDDRLFSGSVRENICGFSNDVDENWMIACAQASYIHDVIVAMPMGYDTLIGELGEGLSGGQKQRVFIARALYRKPGILFMDEATSALDKDSEIFVNQAIKQMNITRIIIAHRASTLASADRVIVLNG